MAQYKISTRHNVKLVNIHLYIIGINEYWGGEVRGMGLSMAKVAANKQLFLDDKYLFTKWILDNCTEDSMQSILYGLEDICSNSYDHQLLNILIQRSLSLNPNVVTQDIRRLGSIASIFEARLRSSASEEFNCLFELYTIISVHNKSYYTTRSILGLLKKSDLSSITYDVLKALDNHEGNMSTNYILQLLKGTVSVKCEHCEKVKSISEFSNLTLTCDECKKNKQLGKGDICDASKIRQEKIEKAVIMLKSGVKVEDTYTDATINEIELLINRFETDLSELCRKLHNQQEKNKQYIDEKKQGLMDLIERTLKS